MNRKPKKLPKYLPGIRLLDIEFDPQEELAAVHKEHRRAAIKQCRFEELCVKHILKQAREVMQNELQKAWLKRELTRAEERGRQLARDLDKEICRSERQALEQRRVVRGRRK